MNYIINEKLEASEGFTAYQKARFDIENILNDNGFKSIVVTYTKADRSSFKERTLRQYKSYKTWERACSILNKGDNLVIQYPEDNDCQLLHILLNKLKRKGINVIALVHDLDIFRYGNRGYSKIKWIFKKYLEIKKINAFSKVIVHNEKMFDISYKECKLNYDKLISLDIFDYVLDPNILNKDNSFKKSVIIAGNLDQNKVGYLKELPNDVQFELYGMGFKDDGKLNVHYNGKFKPDELPKYLDGGFGLVWDGETANTCSGMYGKYLRINNPHKTSLYLASGIPVIIWEEAALSSFIKENNCGITVKSLYDINEAINNISEEEYKVMKNNAKNISELLVNGYHTKKAIFKAIGEKYE